MAAIYLPGEILDVGTSRSPQTKIVGYGIEKQDDKFVACQPGLFRADNGKTWISVQSKRYIPQKGDRVLGIVTGKMGDFFKVDIGAADQAMIHFLEFEGVTKRNRPNIKTGDLLYTQVSHASKHLEPELTCIDSVSRAKGLGALVGGLVFKVSLHLGRRLLSPSCQVLHMLGNDFKFEITVGLNGKVWINALKPKEIVVIRKVILGSEYILDSDIADYVRQEVQRSKCSEDSIDTPMDTS